MVNCRCADPDLASSAMDAAARAGADWAQTPMKEQCPLLRRTLVLLGEEIERICRIITAENGKTLMESRAEVEASLRDARYQLRAVEATN